ncbi:hypothetical protein RT92_20490 [Salmonella enterica subsp. enterica]|uniref:Uncharacterized protein n=1 Tax=Salmonella enterica I TaxID=59201 RepID=A0A5Y3IBK6_SALET|nr:hypothetical protein [Salmonella enterica]ECH8324373.1 hypothetical protein [Salmonella enterica subsp. enterica]EEJ9479970.1 hypothetical protein [Salmonella enterica subsp. enterica serovar Infantis]ECH8333949.1 hypothetical protein [Salmonella enterica subsp. enterica]ECH9435081.1 hypothetical protein [Salmonella enterica subsp. enterica]
MNNDVAVLLFFLAPEVRRESYAACGQYPASGRARDGRFFYSCRALPLLCTRHSPFQRGRTPGLHQKLLLKSCLCRLPP